MKCDAVFEGGGVKGVAFIGAIQEIERRGYTYHQIAGTSAGSIIASLLASGYTGEELEKIIMDMSVSNFLQPTRISQIPLIGRGLSMIVNSGIFSLDRFEKWIDHLLAQKGIRTFDDLPAGKLKVIVSDISNGRLVVLPDDLPRYGLKNNQFLVSRAVRMSSTIPYYFEPFILNQNGKKTYFVDGGILSNFPIWIFDSARAPRWPTFGYRLRGSNDNKPSRISGPVTMLLAMFSTMREAHDRKYIEIKDAERTIFIPVDDVKATDFHITKEQKEHLIELGRKEVRQFFSRWNFTRYIEKHRVAK